MVIDAGAGLDAGTLAGQNLIVASGDDYKCLGLVDHVKPGQRIDYIIEYKH